jgi:site-specific DNA-methyltransferase (adenine-specific)
MKPDKEYNGRATIRMFNIDCMKLLEAVPKKHYELCICDPPYGINLANNSFRQKHDKKNWDISIPDKDIFNELFRISENQIIWGGNYFDLPPSQGFIIWDKKQPENFSSAMCEYAWISFQKPAKIYRKWCVVNENGKKIHPTEKPLQMYKWILKNYAEEGQTIFDGYGGSMSIAIACWDLGFDLDICELDEDYFKDAVQRFENHIAQKQLF